MTAEREPTSKALNEAKRLVASIAGMHGGDWYTLAGELDAFAEASRIEYREKVAAMMLKASIATEHGDTIDSLLGTLATEIVLLQAKLEDTRKWAEMATKGRREFRAAYGNERQDNRQLRAALAAVRVKALPAGAAVGLQREGWEDRCREVLDIIDAALVAKIEEPQ
jgi:hypothetical protein